MNIRVRKTPVSAQKFTDYNDMYASGYGMLMMCQNYPPLKVKSLLLYSIFCHNYTVENRNFQLKGAIDICYLPIGILDYQKMGGVSRAL